MTKPPIQDMTTDHKTNWESEFDQKVRELRQTAINEYDGESNIVEFGFRVQTGKDNDEVYIITDWGHIKAFIKKTLNTTLSDLVSKLEGEERGIKWMQEGSDKNRRGYTDGFNAGIDTAIKIINEMK